jgi:hypothetical protein
VSWRLWLALTFTLASETRAAAPPVTVRFATFNASLNRTTSGQLFSDLSTPNSAQARVIAEIVQRNAPDVILINEFDYDPQTDAQGRTVVDLFHDRYLAVSQNGQVALNYPYRFTAKPNTGYSPADTDEDGLPDTGPTLDFDNNGTATTTAGSGAYANDCFGFGEFRGKYGMVVYSKFPIATAAARTFRNFLWRDMPGSRLPITWYSSAEQEVFRLSSKSHWDLPIDVGGGQLVHFLCAHPTPPVFDGSEDRNGRRNGDEIRFWADYIDPSRATYHRDDSGRAGGLAPDERFVIAGDYNADPLKGDSVAGAAQQLTNHSQVLTTQIPSAAVYLKTSAPTDTADFSTDLRVDYVLPSKLGFEMAGNAVYWPSGTHPQAALVANPATSSDHKLVWADLRILPVAAAAVRDLRAALEDGAIALRFQSAPGHQYRIQEQSTLQSSAWQERPEIAVQIAADNSAQAIIPIGSGDRRRFFRVAITFAP